MKNYKIAAWSRYSLLILILANLLLTGPLLSGQDISDYVCLTGWGISKDKTKEVIILRKFLKGDRYYYFIVSPESIQTGIIPTDSIDAVSASWQTIRSRYSSEPYVRALEKAELYSETMQDAGFTRFVSGQHGIDLTIDLCPSLRPLDRIVFTDLIDELGGIEKPVPLAVSITGVWIREHPDDLKWLDSLARSGTLSIVWINHSYNHHVTKNAPLKENFMLAPATDINNEVLNTEVAMLHKNIIPSAFFRFPGLISDHEVYEKILDFGLIPIGSDAWLAKGQWPVNGSIVLIHANGNEPVGVRDFINLLKNKRTEALSRRWELYDLRESMINDESRK